jgi:DNA (cytosine-5)-methyltransferase 1
MLGKSVAKEIFNVLGNKISKPSGKRILGDEKLLTLVMTQAAKRYGVNPQVIEPRTRREEKDLIYA